MGKVQAALIRVQCPQNGYFYRFFGKVGAQVLYAQVAKGRLKSLRRFQTTSSFEETAI